MLLLLCSVASSLSNYTQVSFVPVPISFYLDKSVADGTTYLYRMVSKAASGSTGQSQISYVVRVTTLNQREHAVVLRIGSLMLYSWTRLDLKCYLKATTSFDAMQ